MVLFFAAPRLESSSRRLFQERASASVGYSSTVSLHALDEILQSDDPVMRVSFKDARTNLPYRVFGDVYYRGSVLTDYVDDRGQGRWLQSGLLPPSGDWLTWTLAFPAPCGVRATAQRATAGPPAAAHARHPPGNHPGADRGAGPVQRRPAVRHSGHRGGDPTRAVESAAVPPDDRRGGARSEFHYVLLTTGFRGGLQIDAAPHANRLSSPFARVLLEQEQVALSKFDAARFPRLRALADEIARETRTQQSDRASLARAFAIIFSCPAGTRIRSTSAGSSGGRSWIPSKISWRTTAPDTACTLPVRWP